MADTEARLGEWNHSAIETILHKASKIDLLLEGQRKLEATIERLTEAVTKLAVIEERQNSDRLALERAFTEIAKLQKRQEEDTERQSTRIEAAINNVSKSIERVHTRLDEHGKELQNDLDQLKDRVGAIEATLPETNRLKEWGYELVRYLAVAGLMYYALKAGITQ